MRQDVGRFLGFLSVFALVAGIASTASRAQELQFDPHAFDAPAKPTGKKARGAVAPSGSGPGPAAAPQQQGGKPRPDRQFGELEGWSPGKEPPKPKDAPNTGKSSGGESMPVKMTPGGNMGTGFTF
jgi:hypothetical protein